MDRFPPGTKVSFVTEGNGNKHGVVQSINVIDGQEIAAVKVETNGKVVNIPCMSLTKA